MQFIRVLDLGQGALDSHNPGLEAVIISRAHYPTGLLRVDNLQIATLGSRRTVRLKHRFI